MNLRTCVACRQKKDKYDMIRVAKTKDGLCGVDLTHKHSGRGAYVCNEKKCITEAIKKKSFNRAFRFEIPNEIYENIKNITENGTKVF